ncbi:MAG: hypothetical protein KKH91_05700 [Elusimicrobia bacterium]|nr:hypothetical protein [Elusimicrobiota bacterium]MBU2614955.1 hypothetical protein [Elusimicrobiota bacterium]
MTKLFSKDYLIIHIKSKHTNIQDLKTGQELIFRPQRQHYLMDYVEGETLTISPEKEWEFKNNTYLTGEVTDSKIDINSLNIKPLGLTEHGIWDPMQIYGEEMKDEFEEYLKGGLRKSYEMEQRSSVKIESPEDDTFDDPITNAMDLFNQGDPDKATTVLVNELRHDWACLDAHNHLAIMDNRWKHYLPMKKRYEIAVKIADLTIPDDFNGVLTWGCIDNRPFLRSLQGCGLALWHLGEKDNALRIFERSHRLSPDDGRSAVLYKGA